MNLMTLNRPRIINTWVLPLCCLVLLAACSGGDSPAQPQGVTPIATGAKPSVSSPQAADSQIDPCSLVSKADVEAAVGRPVLEPKKEQLGNLFSCSYGDPQVPTVPIVALSVFVGSDAAYYAGAVAHAGDAFEFGRDNAASVQPVSGLGDDAYWDEIVRTLNVLSGKYEVEVAISSDAGGLDVARGLAAKALQGLP